MVKNSISIKQPCVYIDYTLPWGFEEYDHTVVYCKCGKLMERGMGLCDQCINDDLDQMEEYNRKQICLQH